MKATIGVFILIFITLYLHAEDGHNLWLRNKSKGSINVVCSKSSPTLIIARQELEQCWHGKAGASVFLAITKDKVTVNYMMPLGFHDIFAPDHHYGPGPWWAPKQVRKDWTPPCYHRADTNGVGFDRTVTGSNAMSQYHEPLSSQFNDLKTCPEKYLLWFHHLPWDYKMQISLTLWDEKCYHYETGLQQVREFQKIWDKVQPYVDSERFNQVQSKLRNQCRNAQIWKDACLLYFQQFSRKPIPYDIECPVCDLEDLLRNEVSRP